MDIFPTPAAGDESRPHLPPLPGCGRPATANFELYRDPAYSSLDAHLYVCEDHADAYALRQASGLTPFRVARRPVDGTRCGAGWDYVAMRPLHAPERTTGAVSDEDIDDAAYRVLYPAGQHPVIDEAEAAVRAAADFHGPTLTRQGAEAVLETLPDLAGLTDRERAGLLARFGRDSLCGTCHGPIQFMPRPATAGPAWGPPYYRHSRPGTAGHIARPAVTQ